MPLDLTGINNVGDFYSPHYLEALLANSPCIDAGSPSSPYTQEPTPNGGRVNMGAYGNTAEASKSTARDPTMLTSHVPTSGAAEVPLRTSITLVFAWPVAKYSVPRRFSLVPDGGTAVCGRCTWPEAGRKMIFWPLRRLQPGTRYTVRLEEGITRADGTPISWAESFAFTTAWTTWSGLTLTTVSAPTPGGAIEIRLALSAAATVEARVLNLAGRPVRTLCTGQECEAGTTTLLWNALSDRGLRVPGGTYLVETIARGADGAEARQVTPLRR